MHDHWCISNQHKLPQYCTEMPPNCPFSTWGGGTELSPNKWFLGHTQVHTPNGILILLSHFSTADGCDRHTDTGIATSAATDCIFALRACDTAWLSMTSTNLPGIGQRYSDDIYAVLLNEATTSQRCSSEARLTYILRLSYHNAEVMIDLRWSSNLQNILRREQGFSNIQFTCKIIRSS